MPDTDTLSPTLPSVSNKPTGSALRTPKGRYWKDLTKLGWTRLGARLPDALLLKARIWLDYLNAGRWLSNRKFLPGPRVQGGREVFTTVAAQIAESPVAYLEFGVFDGYTMRLWSSLLKNPESRLVGFDSFEGLPEDWGSNCPKGTFTRNGMIPQIADSRVDFVKGWFQDTLPQFNFVEREQLVILFDADLYSSTLFVLKELRDRIKVGTILIFGEFSDCAHELRAFEEFLNETGMKFELVVADFSLVFVAFRRVS